MNQEVQNQEEGMNELSRKIFLANKEKGFYDDTIDIVLKMKANRSVLQTFTDSDIKAVEDAFMCQKIVLVMSELSEAVEAMRKGKKADVESYNSDIEKGIEFETAFKDHIKDSFEDEIADARIRIDDLMGSRKIDVKFHVLEKLKYNATRGKKHGKKF